MRRTERVYLVVVLVFALVFASATWENARDAISRLAAREVPAGSAGEARDLDPERIRDLIRTDRLSDHEADFYRKGSELLVPEGEDGEAEDGGGPSP
jgi:hypothetical protein